MKRHFLFLLLGLAGITVQANPGLDWATFLTMMPTGGNYEHYKVVTDKFGNIYVGGTTGTDPKLIAEGVVSPGCHQGTFGGGTPSHQAWKHLDAYLCKFNSDGQRIWATFYGGTGNDVFSDLAVDEDGNVYLAGITESPNAIATTGALKDALTGTSDGFVVRFDSSGKRIWGTYLGGTAKDAVSSISISDDGIYLGGMTDSDNGIATAGAFEEDIYKYEVFGGIYNSASHFLVKMDKNGQKEWGTYYNGGLQLSVGLFYANTVTRVKCDAFGNVYLAGLTDITEGIATPGSFLDSLQVTKDDSLNYYYYDPIPAQPADFLVKFNKEGKRIWGTYLQAESAREITIDHQGNILLAGIEHQYIETSHTRSPITPAAHQQVISGESDVILTKFDSSGGLIWGTYYGGAYTEGHDIVSSAFKRVAITTDESGNLYLASLTSSMDNVVTPDAYDTAYNRGLNQSSVYTDALISKFTPDGHLKWGTYFGGLYAYDNSTVDLVADKATGIALADGGNIYVTGTTNGRGGLNLPGKPVFKDTLTFHGTVPWLARFYYCDGILPEGGITPSANVSLCAGDSITLKVGHKPGVAYTWMHNDAPTGGASDSFLVVKDPGKYAVYLTLPGSYCADSAILDEVIVHSLPEPELIVDEDVLHTGTFESYQWNLNGEAIDGADEQIWIAKQSGRYSVTVTDENGCIATSEEREIIPGFVGGVSSGLPVQVFPNPVQDVLYINVPDEVIVSVRAIDGREVFRNFYRSEIDLSGLGAGVYLIRISDRSGNIMLQEKVIKTGK